MPALDARPGLRVVASVAALDTAPWPAGTIVLRFAPDDAFVVSAAQIDGADADAIVADADAIVADETGFVGTWLTSDELLDLVVPLIVWPLPEARPALVQGLIAGVPAKLWLEADRALLICAGAYAHELAARLG